MVSDSQKIEIAKRFTEQHPIPFAAWTPDDDYESDDDQYLAV
jgi:hypothetical protein